ncbi:MAG: thiol peroxidase [Phycisphaerae bacterium]|nr:thiol peroxidase [Phycisphaerae bacterium]
MARNITLKGNPVTIEGPELKVGDTAPDFTLQGVDMSDVTLASTAGKVRILMTVPSLDTPVCDKETRRFNEEAAKLPNVEIAAISVDLPMAMKRWCGAAGVEKVRCLSDHRATDFGRKYGVLIKGGPLDRFLARAIFVVDKGNKLVHAEYVPEIAQEPNYDAALAAARKAAGG